MNILNLFRKKEEQPHCSAVIVAAGSSERMGEDKLLMNLGAMPVLAHTLTAFQDSPFVDEIVVVTRMEKVEEIAELCKKYGAEKVSKVIGGGATRMESALAGVSAVKSSAKLIAIHDGARPLVGQELILRTVCAAKEHLAAIPVIASTDTLKVVDDKNFVVGSVDRTSTVRVQTPQVFDATLIKGALTKSVKNGTELTDDCSAIACMGVKTYAVAGDEDNIKLTSPRDAVLAAAILKDRGDYLEDRSRV